MLIGNDFLVFKYSVTCKQEIFKLYIIIEMKVTVSLFCAQPLMTIIIFQTRIPNSINLQLPSWFLFFN